MDLTQYELDNGMKVLLLPSKSAPVVACNVWVGVGSADETPDEAGLAHVHEHMLFKGTERRGVGQIAREVESAGGHINAFTSFDQTCYYVVMSSRFFDTGLDILSDAIRRSSFEAEELSRELEVIQEEIKRGEDDPSRMASLKLFSTAFKEHPYRLPVIGTKESVDSFGREDVLSFFHKHYVPENMTVVLAGDFELDEAKQKVEEYFGDFATAQPYKRVERPVESEQREFRAAVVDEAAHNTHLRISFHVPDATHEDIPALELLGTVMGMGEASHLYQRIQRERELVNGIYSGVYSPRDAGMFVVSADYQLASQQEGEEGEEALGASSHREVVEAVMTEVFQFRDIEVSEAEIRRARTLIESQAVYSKQTIEGLAMKLGHYQMVTGDPLFEDLYYERLSEVTVKTLREVARKYFTPENTTMVVSHPKEIEGIGLDELEAIVRSSFQTARQSDDGAQVELDATAPPRVEDASSAQQTKHNLTLDEDGFVKVELSNGATLIVQENHAVEIFSVRAIGRGGLLMETPENNGINNMLSDMITKGTSTRDAVELAHLVESMASNVSGLSGRNTLGIGSSGLSKFFEPCIEILAESMNDAQIPQDELDRAIRFQVQELRARKEQLGAVNYDNFVTTFYKDHPYGMCTGGSEESVRELTREKLLAYKSAMMRPEDMTFVVVGDVSADHAAHLFESLIERPSGASTRPSAPKAPATRETGALVTANLDKNQAHVIVGFDAPVIESDERYALEVLHSVLSGQGGRLFMELRDRQSLAYSVYASMLLGFDTSTFMVNIGTSPEKIEQAVEGIFSEMRRLIEEPPSAEEIASAKRYLIGNHDIGLQRNSARAMSVALDDLYGLGYKRSFDYGDHIQAVTSEDLQTMISRYIDLERAVVSITKPEAIEVPSDLRERALKATK